MPLPTKHEFAQYLEDKEGLLSSLPYQSHLQARDDLEVKLQDESVWEDPHAAGKLNQQLSIEQGWLDIADKYKKTLQDIHAAYELGDESDFDMLLNDIAKQYDHIQNLNFLSGKFDTHNAVVSIHAGAGGIDAMDFASVLMNMYQAYSKKEGYELEIIAMSPGEEAGLKSVTFDVRGKYAYGYLKEEAGVHRLVRISPFNSGKTRETSFALVEVIPADLEREITLDIEEKDLRWDFYQASGKGGQSVNTTYSAVRLVHIPTSITVTCQNERSQVQNKQQALKYLKNKLAALELKKQKDLANELKGMHQSAEWGSQIRNYVLHPYRLVKDVRSGWETSDVDKVLEEGDIMPIIWSVKKGKAT
jgi:peptide chain release factor 2